MFQRRIETQKYSTFWIINVLICPLHNQSALLSMAKLNSRGEKKSSTAKNSVSLGSFSLDIDVLSATRSSLFNWKLDIGQRSVTTRRLIGNSQNFIAELPSIRRKIKQSVETRKWNWKKINFLFSSFFFAVHTRETDVNGTKSRKKLAKMGKLNDLWK